MDPPSTLQEPEYSTSLLIFGTLSGVSVILLMTTVLLSTVIIIHTTQATTPENTLLFLQRVDSLTFPNTVFFYLSVMLTPGWMLIAGYSTYGLAVAVPITSILLIVVVAVGVAFVKHAEQLNTKTAEMAEVTLAPAAQTERQGMDDNSAG